MQTHFKDVEIPGVVDARICSSKVRQKDTRISRGACHMRQGNRLNLEGVIGQLPGRDASLSRVYASDGVPMQATPYRRGDDLAVTITQGQRTSRIR